MTATNGWWRRRRRFAGAALAALAMAAGCAPDRYAVGLWVHLINSSTPLSACAPNVMSTAAFSDGSTEEVTGEAEWTSSATTVLAIAPGLLSGTYLVTTCAAPGETTLTARYQGLTATGVVTVTP